MQKLQKLSAFQGSQLSTDAMTKIYGGDTDTENCTIPVNKSLSASGCCKVSTDLKDSKDRIVAYLPANGTHENSDVNGPC